MVQKIAIAVLILGLVLLLAGLWGRGWRRGGVYFLQPGTRLGVMLLALLMIFGGYWFYFDGSFSGRRNSARVWTSSGTETRTVERGSSAAVSVETPALPQPVSGQNSAGNLEAQAAQAQEAAPVASAAVGDGDAAASQQDAAVTTATAATPTPTPTTTTAAEDPAPVEATPVAVPEEPVAPKSVRVVARAEPAEVPEREDVTSADREPSPVRLREEPVRKVTRKRRDDGTVEVCAVQVQYGVVAPTHGIRTVSTSSGEASRTVTIRNRLGPGQSRERLRLLVEGREVAKLDVSRSRPSVSVRLKVPRDRDVSYSLVGETDYTGSSSRSVSGDGLLLAHERRYDVRMTNPWDRYSDSGLFLEPES